MLLLLLFFMLIQKAYSTPITIVFMDNYAPVSFLSVDKKRAIGINPNIAAEVFAEETNEEIRLLGLPWLRAQDMVKSGKADAMISIVTSERLSYSRASKVPVFYDSYRPFTYSGHPKMKALTNIKSLKDLKDFTLCEYLGNGWIKKYLDVKVKRIEYGRSVDMKISMLASRRCDLIIELSFLVRATVKHYHLDDKIVELPITFSKSPFHLMVSKKSPHQELLTIFDKKAKKMHDNGRIEKIIQFWTSELQH